MIAYPKPMLERYQRLFGSEIDRFLVSFQEPLPAVIRTNTLKITPYVLRERLVTRGWNVMPLPFYPDAFRVETEETLGNTLEHFLGYYYVQDAASMIPPLVAEVHPGEVVLDLCAAPGSKTTQLAQLMQNRGVIVANENDFRRIKALVFNMQRCGVMNTVVTRHAGQAFARKGMLFDKILVDAPCSAEGTVRSDWSIPKSLSLRLFQTMSKLQISLVRSAVACLQEGGTLVYSTCTFAPEENEGVVHALLEEHADLRVEQVEIPELRTRRGITTWEGAQFRDEVKNCVRILPYENDTEGFFVAKLRKE